MRARYMHKIIAISSIVWIVLWATFVYANDDQTLYNEAKTRINSIKNPISSWVPTVDGWRDQKWSIANVLSRMFNPNGKIRSIFIAAFQDMTAWYVPSWTWTGFVDTIIQQTWSTVNIQWDINVEWEIYKNDVLFRWWIWTEWVDEIYYNSWSVGVWVASPNSVLHVGGDIKIGDSTDTCDASKAWAIRFNNGKIELCANY